MDRTTRIFVAGHRGMVGSAILRALESSGFTNVLTATRQELDLLDRQAVHSFLKSHSPQYVVVAAAKVGGIHANNCYPAEFLYENLMIEANLIHGAHLVDCDELLFLGSSCIYPKLAEQPMSENSLLDGHLEPTNEPYAIAKIAGIKLCESYNRQFGRDYRSLMPTNLYGPGDNFHQEDSHVIPALMRRIHEAKTSNAESVAIWGTGGARREFLHVDDLAAACLHIMQLPKERYDAVTTPMQSHLNVGTGTDVSIRELAEMLADVIGFEGEFEFDTSKPDGTPRKLLDTSTIESTGWKAGTDLRDGLESTYRWFCEHEDDLRR